MMLERDDILKLIEDGENSFTEFKREEEKIDDLIKAIAAFANVKRGYLFMGVADDGRVCGIEHPEQPEE